MITETRDLNSDDENGEDLHLQKKWRSGEERIDQNVEDNPKYFEEKSVKGIVVVTEPEKKKDSTCFC